MKTFIDIVLLTILDNELQVLLVKRNNEPFKDSWALPGGRIPENLDIDEAAESVLENKTRLEDVYLEQLRTFSGLGRDPRGSSLSVSYLALVDSTKVNAMVTESTKEVKWFKLSDLPKLAFDHKKIIKIAKERIINKIAYTRVGFELIHKEFTLPELASVFSSIIGKKIDVSNLKKKLYKLDLLLDTNKKIVKKGRPRLIYKLNHKKLEILPIDTNLLR